MLTSAIPDLSEIKHRLESLGSTANRAGMARFGINTAKAYGISIPNLRALAKEIGKDHDLAGRLCATGMHEARILASFIENPKLVTREQMGAWAADFDSWDLCDQTCSLFSGTPHAFQKAAEWSSRPEEFVRRAGFSLIATLAHADKRAPDSQFEAFLPLILAAAEDNRNFVRKAVSWGLRGIGKLSSELNTAAIMSAVRIGTNGSRSAKWIASDALRELQSPAVQARLAAQRARG